MSRIQCAARLANALTRSLLALMFILMASQAIAAPPTGADLSHLSYTATANLRATLLSPADGGVSPSIAAKFVVATVAGAGVELRVNGTPVPATQIGLRAVNKITGETRYEFYGVLLASGPNKVELTALGAGEMRGESTTYTVYGPGRPIRFSASLDHPLRADGGKTSDGLTIVAIDRWDHSAMPGAVMRVTVVSGDVRFRTERRAGENAPLQTVDSPAIELPVATGGISRLTLVAGLLPGEAVIQITSRDVEHLERFYINPNLRKPIVSGLITVGAGSVPGLAGQIATVPDGQQSRLGRIAIFGTGLVGSDILATAAYDTANVLQQQVNTPLVDNPQDRPFQTYGDESYNRNDALSRDHLYARFDRGQSSLMWGEFRPSGDSPDPNSSYNLLVSGVKLELGTSRTRFVGFDANDNIAFARQVLTPTGLSLAGQSLNPNIVVGSDVLTLVVLDRRTGAVLSQTTLVRNVDYTIDYSTGLLRFINIPLPYDDHFNPQVILVQYEYGGLGIGAQTAGAHASIALDRNGTVRFGAGYLNDSNGSSNFVLYEESLQGTVQGGSWRISHVTTRGLPSTVTLGPAVTGGAFSASLAVASGMNKFAFDYQTTTADFNNPFGGFSTPGLTNVNVRATHAFSTSSDITLGMNLQSNAPGFGNNTQSQASIIYHEKWGDWLTAKVGVQTNFLSNVIDPTSGLPLSGSNFQSIVGLGFKIGKRLGASIENLSDIGGNRITPSDPPQTLAQITYTFPGNTKFFVRERWSSVPTESFAGATSSFTNVSLATQSTSIGFEKQLSEATSLDSEYTVDHTNNGSIIYSAYGVRQKFSFGKDVHGDAFAQRANALGGGVGGFFVYGVNAAYTGGRGLKGAVSLQIRTGSQPGSSLTAGASGPLGNDFAIQATVQNSSNLGLFDNQDQIGLAWRPSRNDRGATLLEYDHRIGNVSTLSQHTDAISIQQVYRPCERLELAARYAYKLDGDAYYAPHTSLFGIRADERFTPRYDLGVETQLVTPAGIPGAQTTDFAIENGYRIGGKVRVAAGYNFAGSADPTLTGAPTRRGAYVTLTTVVDSIGGWGKH